MDINREQLAWCAGFFDGEGSTVARKNKQSRPYPGISIGQSGDEAIPLLSRFNTAVGDLGSICEEKAHNLNNPTLKKSWKLSINSFEKTQAVVAMMWPWLSETKKLQAIKVLTDFLEFELQHPVNSLRPRGVDNIATKCTESDILSLRDKYKSGKFTQTQLANEYNLSQSTIGRIINRKVWNHI